MSQNSFSSTIDATKKTLRLHILYIYMYVINICVCVYIYTYNENQTLDSCVMSRLNFQKSKMPYEFLYYTLALKYNLLFPTFYICYWV